MEGHLPKLGWKFDVTPGAIPGGEFPNLEKKLRDVRGLYGELSWCGPFSGIHGTPDIWGRFTRGTQ